MAAKRNAKENTDETTQSPTATALPARGTGPLGGYPVAAGATHCRVHGVGEDGRIKEALTVGQSEDGPVTRIPVNLLGDAALWDAINPGTRVRVVFTRYHGDQLKTKFGQGPIWVVPPRGETVDERRPTREEPPPMPAPDGGGHTLFLVLRQLEKEATNMAEARAQREIQALRELYATQAQMQRDYFAQMTSMFLGERKDERQSEARRRAEEARRDERIATAVSTATRTAIAEAQTKEEAEDEDDDDPEVDAVEAALTGLSETIKPIAAELGKRMAKGAIG